MFGDKGHNAVVALDQIDVHEIPVVIAVQVHFATER
jgi:hypothetical protein